MMMTKIKLLDMYVLFSLKNVICFASHYEPEWHNLARKSIIFFFKLGMHTQTGHFQTMHTKNTLPLLRKLKEGLGSPFCFHF